MPIYEYACKSCGHTLDALQKMSDDPLVDCPECGEAALKRLLSAPRFRLKGEGWSETDFKKDNQRNLAKGDGEPEKKDSSTADKSGDKKESKPTAASKKPESKKTETKNGEIAQILLFGCRRCQFSRSPSRPLSGCGVVWAPASQFMRAI